MLHTIEKVMILKASSVFMDMPEDILADIAAVVEDVALDPEQVLFSKGEHGSSTQVYTGGDTQCHDYPNCPLRRLLPPPKRQWRLSKPDLASYSTQPNSWGIAQPSLKG
jgi:hypothetical protein